MLKHLPNALTLTRLVLAPVIAYALWRASGQQDGSAEAGDWAIAAAAMFVVAALSDLFDGMAARAFNAHSKFGRLIDPIADKALVILPLLVLAWWWTSLRQPLWPLVVVSTLIIVVRDVGVTSMRLSAPDGEGVRVSPLAKWKTAAELIAVASGLAILVTPEASSRLGVLEPLSIPSAVFALWAILIGGAALLSAYTGAQYLRTAPKI